MPLPRQLFDMGISPSCERVMRRAYSLLSDSRELAFSLEEIERELSEGPMDFLLSGELTTALDTLAALKAIDKRKVLEIDYYAFLGEFDTGTWLSRRHFSGE